MDGKSFDITQDKISQLRQFFPEVFTENQIDWEKLKATLGEDINFEDERYVLNWAGKSNAFRVLQAPTTATLVPAREESVDFDQTQHVFIEGENLEVLKVLQKAYYGKIKMIYIDPPYNTGNDHFIYPDKFSETKEEYLKRIGDKDELGYLTSEGLFRKNSKDSGHYHSNWLSMMYPRLFLARNLLRDDGVIFVSIDDNEVHNLRLVMNEVFGEENFEGHIHWRRRHNQPNDPTKMIALVAEHILAYSKNQTIYKESGVGKIQLTGDFSNPDNDPRGDWASKPWRVGSGQSGSKYKITTPTGKIYDEEWMGEESTFNRLLADKRIIFPNNGNGKPRKKYFRFEREKEGQCATNWWPHGDFGHNQGANIEMENLFGFKNLFDNPKPSLLIKNLILISNCKKNDLILDFFAGSTTTAHAAIDLNTEYNGNINYIMVQLPEQIDEKIEAYKAGYKTITEIGKERIRRVIKKIKEEQKKNQDLFFSEKSNLDLGFKVFKLQPSNFKIWWGDQFDTEAEITEQLDAFIDPTLEQRTEENMLYELLLKSGFDLNSKIINNGDFYLINDNELALALAKIDEAIVRKIIALRPRKVITLDKLFVNNDQLKTNTALQMKDAGIDFRTI